MRKQLRLWCYQIDSSTKLLGEFVRVLCLASSYNISLNLSTTSVLITTILPSVIGVPKWNEISEGGDSGGQGPYYQPARCRSSLRRLRTLRPHCFCGISSSVSKSEPPLLTDLEAFRRRASGWVLEPCFSAAAAEHSG